MCTAVCARALTAADSKPRRVERGGHPVRHAHGRATVRPRPPESAAAAAAAAAIVRVYPWPLLQLLRLRGWLRSNPRQP